jgi:hypothetical protein
LCRTKPISRLYSVACIFGQSQFGQFADGLGAAVLRIMGISLR